MNGWRRRSVSFLLGAVQRLYMETKRALTSVDLRALEGEFSQYAGARVDKVYLYGDDLLRVKLRDFDHGRLELLVEVGDTKRVHFTDPEQVPDAPERPPNFAKMLRNRIGGAEFQGIKQYGFDRIVVLEFEHKDGTIQIVAELFGDGNIAVLDATGEVIDCLRTVRLRSRTVAPGAQYEFPDERVDPLSIDFESFVGHMEQSDTDVVRTLATQLDLGGEWAEEICTRAGVEKTLAIEEADEDVYEPLYWELSALGDRLSGGPLDPRVYYADEEPVNVTPVPMEELVQQSAVSHDTFIDALDTYFHELEAADTAEESSGSVSDRPDFESEIEKQHRIIEQQQQAIENFDDQAAAYRQQAEMVYAHYSVVEEVIETVQSALESGTDWETIEQRLAEGASQGIPAAEAVTDVDPEDDRVNLELDDQTLWIDVTTGVEHNADRLYQEAKRIEEKKAGAESAIEDTKERLAELETRREEWEQRDTQETEEEDDRSDRDWLSMPSIPVRQTEHWYERFRWYRTTDGHLVLGGRSADQNEELVKKYLEPGDRFLHTQAHGGPVTILKAADPSESGRDVEIPESSEREAARFAVSYSSIWKDGRFEGDVYAVDHDQVSKTPESGEYLDKGGFAIRGDRTYYNDIEVDVAVGITCEPETRVIGGPPEGILDRTVTHRTVEPGRYAQGDVAKRIYRQFRKEFEDTSFVRSIASPDLIQHFLPPGTSRIVD